MHIWQPVANDFSCPGNPVVRHVGRFIGAVGERAGTIVFGTVASFLLCLAARAGLPDLTTAPAWVLATGIFLSIVAACFQAWRDEHNKLLEVQENLDRLTKPAFDIKVVQIYKRQDGADAYITALLTIGNRGTPSRIPRFVMRVISGDGTRKVAENVTIQEYGFRPTGKAEELVIFPRDWLARKTQEVAIQSGSGASGYLVFLVRGFQAESVHDPGMKIRFECIDAFGNTHSNEGVATAEQSLLVLPLG